MVPHTPTPTPPRPFLQYCRPNQALLAALDGHGPHGHLVSSFLKRQLPVMLADRLGESSAASAASCAACDASFTSASSAASTAASGNTTTLSKGPCCEAAAAAKGRDPAAALTATFLAADAALGQEPGMNVQYSGSTAVLCMLRGRRLTTAWVGDSRAVLARQVGAGRAGRAGNQLGGCLRLSAGSEQVVPTRRGGA